MPVSFLKIHCESMPIYYINVYCACNSNLDFCFVFVLIGCHHQWQTSQAATCVVAANVSKTAQHIKVVNTLVNSQLFVCFFLVADTFVVTKPSRAKPCRSCEKRY